MTNIFHLADFKLVISQFSVPLTHGDTPGISLSTIVAPVND